MSASREYVTMKDGWGCSKSAEPIICASAPHAAFKHPTHASFKEAAAEPDTDASRNEDCAYQRTLRELHTEMAHMHLMHKRELGNIWMTVVVGFMLILLSIAASPPR